MKIYIISLIKDKHKREKISFVLDKMGIKYEFVDAIYGKELDRNILKDSTQKGKILTRGFEPTSGEIGCSFSHLKTMEKMLANNEEWACIFEDDVILDHRFKDFILTLDSQHLCENNLYLLGGQNGLITEKFISKSFFGGKILGNQKFSKIVKSEVFVNRACCYLVSRKFAQKYVEHARNYFFLADDWKHIKDAGIFNTIYLSDFVDHPIDLSDSNLEKERLEGEKGKSKFKNLTIYKVSRYFYFGFRILYAQLNRFLV